MSDANNTTFAPVGQLAPLQKVAIGGGQPKHPSADSVISRAHRDCNDRNFVIVGSDIQPWDLPRAENNFTMTVKCTVVMRDLDSQEDFTFSEIGDANADNVSGNVKPHFIRMAATRGFSRALSMALNIPDAVADELAEGLTGAPAQTYQQPQQNYQAPVQGGAAAPPQPGVATSWNGKIWFGDDKGKHYQDPSVGLKALEWAAAHASDRNKQPDMGARELLQAEINRRNGVVNPATPPPNGQVNAPPVYNQSPSPQQTAAPAQNGGWKATAHQVQQLTAMALQQGVNYPLLKERCAQNFGAEKNDPFKLDRDEFNMMLASFGGQPV